MVWIKRFLFIGLVIWLSSCALALPKRILPVTGQVINQATGQPVEGAIIVMRWQGTGTMAFVDQHTECYHVETATTDADGRFSTKSWREASQYRNLGLKERMDTVYKAGYRHVRSKDGEYYLKRDKGRVEKRLEYLQWMAGYVSCGSEQNQKDELLKLYESLYQEALEISNGSMKQRKILNSLKYSLDVLSVGWDEAQKRRAAGVYSR